LNLADWASLTCGSLASPCKLGGYGCSALIGNAPGLSCPCQAFFRSSISVQIGDGRSTLFWSDNWLQGSSVEAIAPALIALVGRRTRNTQTVAEALLDRNWRCNGFGDRGAFTTSDI